MLVCARVCGIREGLSVAWVVLVRWVCMLVADGR